MRFSVPCCFGLLKDCTHVSEEEMYTTIPEEFCRRFTVSELQKATNNFDQFLTLGWGVYKGHIIMNGTNKLVAVYNHQIQSTRRFFSFKTSIQFLCQLHHPNILSLVGYCIHKKGQMLVVDYMPNLSLDRHLRAYGAGVTTTEPLSWRRRLEICIGAARGLHYLHTGAKYAIIHRDISSRTILLDENWVPKLSGFGLSKRGPLSLSKKLIRLESAARARCGYVAPEYDVHGELTEKSDVFSFGMVLLEVVTAKLPNHQLCRPIRQEITSCLVPDRKKMQTVFDCVRQDDNIADILDPFLVGKIGSECLKRYMSIAERCLDYEKSNRPAMGEVEVELEHALQQQQIADGFYEDANCNGEMPI